MTIAKPSFGLICLAITASNIATMSRWSEARTLPAHAPLGQAPVSRGVSLR